VSTEPKIVREGGIVALIHHYAMAIELPRPTARRLVTGSSTGTNAGSIEKNKQCKMLAKKLSRNAQSLASRSGEPLRNAVIDCTD
jgi:hypothetical protein